MKRPRSLWMLGLGAILLVILVPLIAFWPKGAEAKEDPWANVPTHATHVEHKDIVSGEFASKYDGCSFSGNFFCIFYNTRHQYRLSETML